MRMHSEVGKNQPDLERQVAVHCGMQDKWRRLKMGGVEVINENKFSKLSGVPSWKAFMLHQKLHVEDFSVALLLMAFCSTCVCF